MNKVCTYPTGKEIDTDKLRRIDIIYPNHRAHHIIPQYVQTTKDGKYILNYLETFRGNVVPLFTELIFVEGEWAKNPYHKEYVEYDFEPFNQELSDSILEQLPEQMYFKIIISADKKAYDLKEDKQTEEREPVVEVNVVETHNNSESLDENENLYYMVLLANYEESKIKKDTNAGKYNFEIPFPVFLLPYVVTHEANSTNPSDDINSYLTFNQNEYTRGEIPVSVRRAISRYLSNKTPNEFDINGFPLFNFIAENGKKYTICFVSCSDIVTYDTIYKSESLCTDIDAERPLTYDNDLESALHGEIPLSITLKNGEIKYNNVPHSVNSNIWGKN